MSKEKKKPYKVDTATQNIMTVIAENRTKKGKIKGKNKKQTNILVGACVHHIMKKGKIKPTVFNPDSNTCQCSMCGARWGGEILDKKQMQSIIGKYILPQVDQYKYLAVAVNAGADAVKYGSELGSMLKVFPSNYNKIAKVVRKKETIRKKKNNKDNKYSGSSIGGWRRH